jgi:hypothetical protein
MNDPPTLSAITAPMDLSVETQTTLNGSDLEGRVRRLEEEITALKDTKALEERVALRVAERLQKNAVADQFTATAPAGSRARGTASFSDERPVQAARASYKWLLFDMVADARLIVRMLFDNRYAQAWTTHLVVWLFIPAILTSRWWFLPAYIPFIGSFFDKALDLLLAFCVYKALSREARRYRDIFGATSRG